MRVLFVTRGFPSETDVMDGNYEAGQAKALAAKGCQVSVITIHWTRLRRFYKRNRISHRVVDGVDVYECTRISFPTRLGSYFEIDRYLARKSFKQLFKRCLKEQGMPDVVHAHIVSLAAFASFLKEEYHLPFVITEHWTEANKENVSGWVKKASFAYHIADRVICVSQALAASLKRNFHVESLVINNMVSDQFFDSCKVKRSDTTFKFIAVGAFRKNKGFDILVDAFAQCKFPDSVTLDIVGDGSERSLVESKVKQLGLSNQVKILGTRSTVDVNTLLCNSDCFVLSSRLETFAIVVIEAMAKGLPVIATRSGGPETFLLPEHGILVEKENVEELTQAMNYMTEHYHDYSPNGIRQFCYDHFSQSVIADRIIGIYKQVLNKNLN